MGFEELGLSEKVMEGVRNAGYEEPTPVQAQAIPLILEGKDVVGHFECIARFFGQPAGPDQGIGDKSVSSVGKQEGKVLQVWAAAPQCLTCCS